MMRHSGVEDGVQGVGSGVEDGIVGFEDAVRQEGFFFFFFGRVQLRRLRRQRQQGEVAGDAESERGMAVAISPSICGSAWHSIKWKKQELHRIAG